MYLIWTEPLAKKYVSVGEDRHGLHGGVAQVLEAHARVGVQLAEYLSSIHKGLRSIPGINICAAVCL